MNRLKLRLHFAATLLTLAAVSHVDAADATLSADVEVIYPVPPAGRDGGVSPMNGSQMERLDAAAGGAMLHLSDSKAPVTGVWWFPNHLPMKPEQAMIGDPHAKIALEIQAGSPVETEVTVLWRGVPDGPTGETAKAGPFKIAADHPTHIELPIPKPADGQKMTGLIFGFAQAGDYQIKKLAITRLSATLVDAIPAVDPRKAGDITITGQASTGIDQVTLRFAPELPETQLVEKQAAVRDGKFTFTATTADLPAGFAYKVTAEPIGAKDQASPAQRLYVFPAFTDKALPPVTRQGSDLIVDGKPLGFVGFNYTRFDLGLGNNADYEVIAHDVMQMSRWGVRAVRIPIDLALTQPQPGVFPGNPWYAEAMKSHNLDPRYWDQIDYFLALAGSQGIYSVIDWHGFPTDPYSYFKGGHNNDRNTGKPGTAIAYLAPTNTKEVEFDLLNPLHLKTLLDADRWVTEHLKGNTNVLAMEVPFNEPHTQEMAVESTWRKMTDLCAKAIGEIDPTRLTFIQAPSYAHNNLLPSVTWLPPDRVTGSATHFYQANGPVPLRPDAKSFPSPWLARDLEATFGWGFQTVVLPFSAVDYPIYNGETGMYGHESLMPKFEKNESASILMEAQLVQEYATGMAGHLEWTIWSGHDNPEFVGYSRIYEKLLHRFGPVYAAGPISRREAQVAFIQNTNASPANNGHNFACTPFAKAALDLHLGIVHYLTDAQFRYTVSAELSLGLEQVTNAAGSVPYKAIIVDKRQLDPQVEAMLKTIKVPVLFLEKADDLTAEKFAKFLTQAKIDFDAKTAKEMQVVEGPQHLIVYRRLDGSPNPAKIFPHLKHAGPFQLVDETGKTVFVGDAAALSAGGIDVNLPLWRSAIFKIVSK